MKPVLAAWPAKKRTTFFPVFGGGILLLTFLIVAFATQNFFLALLIPPALAIAGAWALVGWPEIKAKDGKPFVEARYKPYLFFVLAPLFALLLYPILGIALTQAGIPLKWLAIVSIVLSIGLAVAGAYFLVGFPNVYASARRRYEEIPPERRPFLFFPITVVLFLIIYLTLGVTSTRLMDEIVPGDPTALLNIQVLILTPLCLAIAALIAWLLVGIPKPQRAAEMIPKVTGKHRPRLFAATLLAGGIVLTTIIGAILTVYADAFLPPTAILALAILLGFSLAFGLAALSWGTPARWRQYDDYKPGVHPRMRVPLLVGVSLAVGIAIAVGIGLANIDLFWGLLAGGLAAGITLMLLTGTHRRIAARKGQSTLVPELPDGMKPLILFPTWIVISVVLFAVLTYILPGLVPVNALLALLVGLGATFFVLEQPLLKELREDRRREREKKKAWEARRKAKLAEAETNGGSPPDA